MSKKTLPSLEILLERNNPLIHLNIAGLLAPRQIAVRAGFANCPINNHSRRKPVSQVTRQICRTVSDLRHLVLYLSYIQKRLRRHRLGGVRVEVIPHQFQKRLIAHLPAQRIQEERASRFLLQKVIQRSVGRKRKSAIANLLKLHRAVYVRCLQQPVVLSRTRYKPDISLKSRQDPTLPKLVCFITPGNRISVSLFIVLSRD